ncbi:MAG: M3 family metallopeptidase [Methylobacillus sp.]|jgi:oligopeptidase A|nr:M3 family metallopeptidase [Methylobacillus sp.]
MQNPLLHFSGLPQFDQIEPGHVTPAITQLLDEARELIAALERDDAPPNWKNFARPLEDMEEKIARAWSQVSHMNAVVNTPELREAYNANLPVLTAFYADLSQNETLYAKFRALRASAGFEKLDAAQRKIVENELRDFRLGGAELPEDQKARFKEIQESLSTLSAKFEENLLDTTNDFAHFVEQKSELAGIPEDALQAAREAAEADKKTGWKFTLHFPSYMPVLQYADDRALREKLYFAYATRASEFGKPEWDNTALITQILELRAESAKLLGYANYAEVSLATKMAQSVPQVLDFLRSLAARARPFAERDMAELKSCAAEKLALPDMQAWDVAYVSEKLREEKYAFSDQEVKQYFPEPRVLQGLFKVIETLYGVRVKKSDAPVWHKDVGFYDIADASGALIGQFYLDLYARNGKRGGAWMDEAVTRRRIARGIETPVAFLTCNFAAPVGGKPALFTHDEVITLFHEFGHGLHHLLTRVEEYGVSGIKGVEWDAVELPSQFMENFCWEWDVLKHMTCHVESGEHLPRALFDKMVAAKNFQAGMQTLRQIEFALFDMLLHGGFDPRGAQTPLQLLEQVRDEIAVVHPPQWNRFPNNFSHIFAGGYAAGYYSYKWAEVLSADAYGLFEENGVLSAETGHRFWSEILAQGGARSALESFVAFRGRAPTLDALLRHNGMTEAVA